MEWINLFRAPGYQGRALIHQGRSRFSVFHLVFGSTPKFPNYV